MLASRLAKKSFRSTSESRILQRAASGNYRISRAQKVGRMRRSWSLRLALCTFPTRQLCCLPIHSHADARTAAGVVEKNEFLQRARLQLAIFSQFQGNHGCSVGLARCINGKRIRFPLDIATYRI